MENLNNSRGEFEDVPGEISYIKQRSRGGKVMNAEAKMSAELVSKRGEMERKADIRRKAKEALLIVAGAALLFGGLMVVKDGEEHRPKSQEEWKTMIENSAYGANADIDYGEDLSMVDFSYGGTHYHLEDKGNDGSFEKGHAVKNGGEKSADFAFTDFGLSVDGAVGELDSRMN